MAETLRVNPLELHQAGGDVLDAMDVSRSAHAQYHEALESAVPGLPTEAAGALQGLIAAWTDQREDLHRAIGNHGMNMQDAAIKYHQADQDQSEHIKAKAMDLGL